MKQQRVIERKNPRGWWDRTSTSVWKPPWFPRVRQLEAEPQSLSSLKKEFSKVTEIVKQIKCLLGAKYVLKNTQADSELRAIGVAEIAYMGAVFWVTSDQSSCSCPHLAWLRVLPGGCTRISQPRWIPAWRFLGGWQDILWAGGSSILWPLPRLRTFSAHVSSQKIPFATRMRKMWSCCLPPNQGSVPAGLLSRGVSRRLVAAAQPGPVCLLPQSRIKCCGYSEEAAVYCVFTEWGGWGTLLNESACSWPQEEDSGNGILRTSSFLCWG